MKANLTLASLWKHALPAALLLVVVVNVCAFFLFPKVGAAVGAETGTDGYREIAENIVKGNGFIFAEGFRSTVFLGYMKREPVYPLFLSVILLLTGTLSPAVLCFCQTALSLITGCLIYRLGQKIFSVSTGRLAVLIYAVHPLSFWYSTRFAGEAISVPLMLLSLLLVQRFFEAPTHLRAVQVGLSLGLAALARSSCVTLVPVILLFALIKWRPKLRQGLASAFVIAFFYLSVQSLWVVRNYAISGEIVPFTTMSGIVFFWGNQVIERFDLKKYTAGAEPDKDAAVIYRSVQAEIGSTAPDMSLPRLEARTDKRFIAMARQFVFEQPLFLVRKFLWGTYLIWFLSDTTAKSWGWTIFQMPLVALACIGLYRQRRWDFNQRFLLCAVAAYILPLILLSPFARYSLPVMPIVILFSASTLAGFMQPLQNESSLS